MNEKRKMVSLLSRILNRIGLSKDANLTSSVDNSLSSTTTASNRKLFILGGVRVNISIKCDSDNCTDTSGSFHVNRSSNKF